MRLTAWLPVFFLAGTALSQAPQPAPQPPPKKCSVPLVRVLVPANADPGIAKRMAPGFSRMPKVPLPAPPCEDAAARSPLPRPEIRVAPVPDPPPAK